MYFLEYVSACSQTGTEGTRKVRWNYSGFIEFYNNQEFYSALENRCRYIELLGRLLLAGIIFVIPSVACVRSRHSVYVCVRESLLNRRTVMAVYRE